MFTHFAVIAALASPAPDSIRAESSWSAGDTVGASLAAGLGGAASFTLATMLGRAASDRCEDDYGPSYTCMGDAITTLSVAAVVGNFGAMAGASLYGHAVDADGSPWAALGASSVGQVTGGLVAAGLCSTDDDAACVAGFVLGGLVWSGMTGLGYALTVPDETDTVAHYGGLLDYDPAHGLRVGAPSATFEHTGDDDFDVGLTLTAGRF